MGAVVQRAGAGLEDALMAWCAFLGDTLVMSAEEEREAEAYALDPEFREICDLRGREQRANKVLRNVRRAAVRRSGGGARVPRMPRRR